MSQRDEQRNEGYIIAYDVGEPCPIILPGRIERDWMNEVPSRYAYRCLPLTIANSYGWELVTDCAVVATWNGGPNPGDIEIQTESTGTTVPVSHFGSGVLTFHVNALLRTSSMVDLWVGGPPNKPKDGISPLTGIVETDWAPMTFTMNWRFTRPNHPVRFDSNEAFGFIFPISRQTMLSSNPCIRSISEDPEVEHHYKEWKFSRDAFIDELRSSSPRTQQMGWQKHYHQGRYASGKETDSPHLARLRVKPFRRNPL